MSKVRRVYEIAREMGVDSKAIIAKCAAEGVPGITKHMDPVKAGLEASIREWFSDAAAPSHSSVEQAAPVDLERARKVRRKRGGPEDGGDSVTATATAVAPPPPTAPAAPAPATGRPRLTLAERRAAARAASQAAAGGTAGPTVSIPSAPAPAPTAAQPHGAAAPAVLHVPAPIADEAAAETSAPVVPELAGPVVAPPAPPALAAIAPAPAQPAAPEATPAPPKVITAVGQPNVPRRPEVKPGGPRLVTPQAAKLSGPKVVRIEQPDIIQAPRPRRPAGEGGPGGPSGPSTGITRSRGPARGRGAGPVTDDEAEGKPAAGKRRSLTTRRGRFAEALPTGPTKFSEQDLIELDARLNRATGFLKQRRRDLKKREGASPSAPSAAVAGGRVEIAEPITIKSLSAATGVKSTDIIKYLFDKSVMATINSAISADMAVEVALDHDIDLVVREQQTAEEQLVTEFQQRETLDVRRRPPVVTVMGHVDHGKTSLLDRIRTTDVAAHEAGGITQHIGAYRVTVKGGDGKDKTVVFLDTPGHEAFTSMRARGAGLTDLVVLVVAADDGVMPQTLESVNHARAAGVPIVVALNKIDKPEATEANIRKIYGQLAEHGLNPTEWGGTTELVKVSATTGKGVADLLEILDYQAELLELKADFGGAARGVVIEALMHPGRGPVGRVLVQQGTMRVGDFIVVGRAFGRVRDMIDERGRAIEEAGPASPVEVSGLDILPDAGDKFYIADTLQQAEEISRKFRDRERLAQLASQTRISLEAFSQQLATGQAKEMRVVLKADVQGSIDVLRKTLTDLSTPEVSVKVLHTAVGGITESDVLLADASDAIVIGFHVIAPSIIRDLAEQRHVEIRLYRIIYEIAEDIRKALEGLLEPESREEVQGEAEVRQAFRITKVGTVAGCFVSDGVIHRSSRVRVVRDGQTLTENRSVDSLRRLKEDVKEVRSGLECGIKIAGFDDIQAGDKIVCYNVITVKRKLGQSP